MSLHHLIVGPIPPGYTVDHINHDSLDNRRANLRITTVQINTLNRTLARNNTTGETGTYCRDDKQCAVAFWSSAEYVQQTACYGYSKYGGKEAALVMAKARRAAEIAKLPPYVEALQTAISILPVVAATSMVGPHLHAGESGTEHVTRENSHTRWVARWVGIDKKWHRAAYIDSRCGGRDKALEEAKKRRILEVAKVTAAAATVAEEKEGDDEATDEPEEWDSSESEPEGGDTEPEDDNGGAPLAKIQKSAPPTADH